MAGGAGNKPGSGWGVSGISMKQLSLVTLTFQNSALLLIMHYSRIMPQPGGRYFTSTAVFLSEVLKLAINLAVALYEASRNLAPRTPLSVLFESVYTSVFSGDGWKLTIPAALYILQNTLQFVALSHLDVVHVQVLYQLKILTTAVFSVLMLGRSLSNLRWLSLVILTLGVAIVSIPDSSPRDPSLVLGDDSDGEQTWFPRSVHELGQGAAAAADVARELTKRAVVGLANELLSTISTDAAPLSKRSASYQGIHEDQAGLRPKMDYSVGLAAVLVASVVSGLTGVYFEKVLKDSPFRVSLWTRNLQLCVYSLGPALLAGVVVKDGSEVIRRGFFSGYNGVVWTVVVTQALGGVLTSLCIKYADNIAKNFATSISILVSAVFSVWFFAFKITGTFLVGTTLVLLATYLYGISETMPRRLPPPPPINVASYDRVRPEPGTTPTVVDMTRLNLDPLADAKAVGLSTSRPASPLRHHQRPKSSRSKGES